MEVLESSVTGITVSKSKEDGCYGYTMPIVVWCVKCHVPRYSLPGAFALPPPPSAAWHSTEGGAGGEEWVSLGAGHQGGWVYSCITGTTPIVGIITHTNRCTIISTVVLMCLLGRSNCRCGSCTDMVWRNVGSYHQRSSFS